MVGPGGREPVPVVSATASTTDDALTDPGAVRNTLLQFGSQVAAAAFTAGLTLYLVRALGPAGYGVYALAYSIGGLLLFPAGMGLPMAVGRFLADHRENLGHVRAIFRLGLRLQLPAAVITAAGLFALSGLLADAYGEPRLGWPLRWMAVAVLGQALFAYVSSMVVSIRRVSVSVWMYLIESAAETSGSVTLVVAGTGAAGAMLGKAIGYGIATIAGLYLTLRLLGGARNRPDALPEKVGVRAISRYAGAMLVVDVTWSAITQVDVLLIGALLTAADVGSFGAVVRILTVVGYLGLAVSAGVAPRLSLGGGAPDARLFNEAIRYLIIAQGVVLAPMVVWAKPIVALLLGSGYGSADGIMRVLALWCFVGAPAALITVSVTYLGEVRRRVSIMLATLVLGLAATYVLLRTVGLVGAAIADDLVQIVYVSAHVWICSRLIPIELRRLAWSTARTLVAGGAMALVLFALGTSHLSPGQWVAGLCAGVAAYGGMLLLTHELSLDEVRVIAHQLWKALRPTVHP